jgi:uncharacterized membrane protein
VKLQIKEEFYKHAGVMGYDDQFKAEEVFLMLSSMQNEYLIYLEDAVVDSKDQKGKVKLPQIYHLTGGRSGFRRLLGGAHRPHIP